MSHKQSSWLKHAVHTSSSRGTIHWPARVVSILYDFLRIMDS